ncbi:MAG: Rid family hydrolase [Planctomycetota bacterium]|jgi:2-aminomuconate deaminase|nr:Rid family hydrolase [Planctomycetota bacterium]
MSDSIINTNEAPEPVGAYPHARRVGDLLFLSGVGSRIPGTNEIPGGPIVDQDGNPRDYDVSAQTEQVVTNIKAVLQASGLTLNDIVDVTAFLIDMDRDFDAYNQVYAKHFTGIQAARTTLSIRNLPTPIAVEFKVVASFSGS